MHKDLYTELQVNWLAMQQTHISCFQSQINIYRQITTHLASTVHTTTLTSTVHSWFIRAEMLFFHTTCSD